MKRFLNNLSFRGKIMWICSLLFFASMTGSGLAYYQYTAKDVETNFMDGAGSVLTQLTSTLDLRLDMLGQRVQGMLSNATFVRSMSDFLTRPSDGSMVKTMGEMATFLKDLEMGESLVQSTYIYTEYGEFENFIRMRNWNFDFKTSSYYYACQENPLTTIHWLPVIEDEIFIGGELVIPYVRQFSVDGYAGKPCYLVMQLKKHEIDRILSRQYGYFDKLLIVDNEGNLIAGSQNMNIEELMSMEVDGDDSEVTTIRNYSYEEEDYLVIRGSIPKTGWSVFGLKKRSSLLGSLKKLRTFILEISGAVLLLAMLALLLVSRQLTSALRNLEKRMSIVQSGDFEVRFFYPYHDEVGGLAKSFNYMVEEIQRLVKKQEETIQELKKERDFAADIQKQKRKAELKALQAQINPHFLYNTLNAITWQAADQGAEEISILSSSLGKFFRISLSKGEEVISLKDELDHVTSYLDIQSIRYQSKLHYEIDVPEEYFHYQMLKLILQPLAENAIYHGIKEKEGRGNIWISAVVMEVDENKLLEITIFDDGIGIPEQKLKTINDLLMAGEATNLEGYGIFNVNERIRLYFGENFGLSYESEEGSWTKAIVRLPVILPDI